MLTLDVQITALSPLAMRSDSAPQGEKTAHFISGSTFIGTLASAHRFFYGDAAGDFTRFFHSGAILYPYLYPANCPEEAAQAHRPVYPIPKTAISCKRHPGYRSRLKRDQHGVFDSLLDWAQFKLSGERDSSRLEAHEWCSICRAAMEYPKEAFYRRLPRQRTRTSRITDSRLRSRPVCRHEQASTVDATSSRKGYCTTAK